MSNPTDRLINVVVEIDPDYFDANALTGMTTAGHIELQNALTQVGTIMLAKRLMPPVPAPPVLPVTNEKTRAYGRRRDALDRAAMIAAHQQVGVYDAEIVVRMAREFEAYLKGDTTGEAL